MHMIQLAKELKKLLKNKDIEDIILFGSQIKGKLNPSDLDIAIIINNNLDKIKLKEKIQEITKQKLDLQFLTIKDFEKPIHLTLIKEGYSIKNQDYIHNILRIKPIILFKYSLKDLTASKKVMFERAIKSFKGIEKLSNRVVLVPIETSKEFSDFLKQWNLDIDSTEYELIPLLRKGL